MTTSYQPQPDDLEFDTQIAKFHPRQREAIAALDDYFGKYVLYGGAMGGGKSYLLRWYCVRFLILAFAIKKLRWVQVMLACEDYPSLKDRQLTRIEREFPPWLGRSYTDHKVYGRCYILSPKYGNGVICLRNLDDSSKYASSEFALIAVDELTKNLLAVFHDLRTRIRWPGFQDHETKFLAGTNPGSVGHGWVKNLWINRSFPEEFHPPFSPVDYRPFFKFIKSKAEDNPSLDSSYWAMLGTLPKALRKAFRDGDWDTFIGQAFQEWDPQRHVITPIPVPENAPMYFTFDWGFGAPFSMGWWWVDNDGRLYRFHEKYGWTGESNVGLRLSEDELVGVMLLEEKKYKINAKQIVKRLAGHDCFARRANPRGGGQGPSTATVFAQHGVRLVPGDPSRDLKIRQFHNRLALPVDGSPPMLQVYSTCEQFIRTIPDLVVDPNNIEYIDEAGEAHCFDEACHVLMARPISVRKGMGEVPVMRREVPLTRNMTVQDVAGLEIQELRDEMEGLRDMEDQQVREALGL